MKRLLRPALLLLVLAGLGLAAWKLFPTREERIRRRLVALAEAVSFPPDEPLLQRAAYARRLEGFFTPDVEIALRLGRREARSLSGRADLAEAAAAARGVLRGLEVKFFDINVAVGPDGRTAEAEFTAEVRPLGDADYYVPEFRVELVRPEAVWLVRRIATQETFEP